MPVFESTEHTFVDVALAVDGTVVVYLDLAVGLGRDDRHDATLDQPEPQGIAVVALVRDQVLRGWHGIDREHGDLGIVRVSRRQEQDMGTALVVAE